MNTRLDGRRLVIAYNPHSSRASEVQAQVFDRLKAAGVVYDTIEVRQAPLEENVRLLAPEIQANDIVLSAAGDGSAHAVFHTIMAADQPGVELGFLAYGNFNDLPHTFTDKGSLRDPVALLEMARTETIYPLNVHVDGKPLRSALLYATVGWTARAASQFDDPSVRGKLRRGGAGLTKSLWRLLLYYYKSRRLSVLPPFRYNQVAYSDRTDVIFANGPAVARLFRSGKRFYLGSTFLFRMLDVRKLVANTPFLAAGLLGRMRGEVLGEVVLDFEAPSSMPIQCDGEVVELEAVRCIEVRKSSRPLTVLASK